MKYIKKLNKKYKVFKSHLIFSSGKKVALNIRETAEFDLYIRHEKNFNDPTYSLASICQYCIQPYYPSRTNQKYCWDCQSIVISNKAKQKSMDKQKM
jgi:hypothetical protein